MTQIFYYTIEGAFFTLGLINSKLNITWKQWALSGFASTLWSGFKSPEGPNDDEEEIDIQESVFGSLE